MVPCAFCGLPGPETELQCFSCQNIIPFDIASGVLGEMESWVQEGWSTLADVSCIK